MLTYNCFFDVFLCFFLSFFFFNGDEDEGDIFCFFFFSFLFVVVVAGVVLKVTRERNQSSIQYEITYSSLEASTEDANLAAMLL